MMEKWILWIGLLLGCCACTESKPTIGLDNCDVVAVKKYPLLAGEIGWHPSIIYGIGQET